PLPSPRSPLFPYTTLFRSLFLFGAIIGSVIVTAVFGWVCVRYTRIFFSILTLALSQVLWSLAFKFFWVTGGTDGLRVPTPSLLVDRKSTRLNSSHVAISYA